MTELSSVLVEQPAGSPQSQELGSGVRKKKKLLNGPNITVSYPSGAKYVGSLRDGKLHGYGEYIYATSGDVYKGEWHGDVKHGHGTYLYGNGNRYVGEWYMGKRNGKGRFIFKDGDEYSGGWRDDQMDGYGMFILERNGNCYAGYWKDGLRHGKGSLFSGNGDRYEGAWVEGKEHGLGIFCQVNEDVYCGHWDQGTMEGKGIFREKGFLYDVEYVGGYIISKVPHEDSIVAVDEDWVRAFRMYNEWVKQQPAPAVPLRYVPTTRTGGTESEGQDEASLRAELAVLQRRLESLMDSFNRSAFRYSKQAGDSSVISPSADEKYATIYREQEAVIDAQKTRIALLERSLEEMFLLRQRMTEEARQKDAMITALNLRYHQYQKRAPINNGPPTTGDQEVCDGSPNNTEDNEIFLFMPEEIERRNGLLKLISELQTKSQFLVAENAKLQQEVDDVEDRYTDANTALDQAQLQLETITNERSKLIQQIGELLTLDNRKEDQMENPLIYTGATNIDITEELKHANRLNTELVYSKGVLQEEAKKQQALFQQQIETLQKGNTHLTDENEALRQQVSALKSERKKQQESYDQIIRDFGELKNRYIAATEGLAQVANQRAVEPALIKSLDDKIERIANLESENANLERQLTELRAQIEEEELSLRAACRSSQTQLIASDVQVDQFQKEMKKANRKIKKLTTSYNSSALQLYEVQKGYSRRERVFRQLHGSTAIAVLVNKGGVPKEDLTLKLNDDDPKKLTVCQAQGEIRDYEFDYCFSDDATPEATVPELNFPVSLIWHGYQASFVAIGNHDSHSGGLLSGWLPLLIDYLHSEHEDVNRHHSDLYSVTYSVAVVEITPDGGVDCLSGTAISSVKYNDHGYVVPTEATYVDCTADTVASSVAKLSGRIVPGSCSHVWVQVQRTVTHQVQQSRVVGRLTLLDLCAHKAEPSPLGDTESLRFDMRSIQQLKDVCRSLTGNHPTVPYSKTVETSLLYDVLGGNSVTTVLACLSPSVKSLAVNMEILDTLEFLSQVRNGPMLQDFESSDVLRWRGIVSALCSDVQSEHLLMEIDDIRQD